MTRIQRLLRRYEANIARGDISEHEEAGLLAQIAETEIEEVRAFPRTFKQRTARAA